MPKAKEKSIEIRLVPLNIAEFNVEVKGKTPLLMDKFPEEKQMEILAKQTGVSKSNKKMLRDTKKEVLDAIHMTSKGKIGIPVYAFKCAMMECTSFVGDKFFSRKLVSGAVKIMNAEDGLLPIAFKKQDILKHNIAHNTKFTPQFYGWTCKLKIQYDKNNIAASDIVNLLEYAGFYIGVGAWRPKGRDGGSGEFGMFEVKYDAKK